MPVIRITGYQVNSQVYLASDSYQESTLGNILLRDWFLCVLSVIGSVLQDRATDPAPSLQPNFAHP